jgi:DNA polymerase theta
VEHVVDFTTGKNDTDLASMSMIDQHEINARDFFVPTQVLLIQPLFAC